MKSIYDATQATRAIISFNSWRIVIVNTKERSSLPRAVIVFVVLPAALYFGLDFVVSSLLPSMSSDGQLLCFQAVLALMVFAGMFSTGLMRDIGWRGPKGWSYLWVLGPLWLGIVTPVAAAISFYLNEPQTVLTYFVISALVAFNEETIFRSFFGFLETLAVNEENGDLFFADEGEYGKARFS